MLIADTFKLDRLYLRSFRRLMAISFQRRGQQSIQNFLQAPTDSTERLEVSRSRKRPNCKKDTVPSQAATSGSGATSTPKQIPCSLPTQVVRKTEESCRTSEDKVLNFLDSNLTRIHTNNRELSLRKTKKYRGGTRCSTEVYSSGVRLEPFSFPTELRVSKKDCSYKSNNLPSVQPWQQRPIKPRYSMRKNRQHRSHHDKENIHRQTGFCPWDSGHPQHPSFG